MVKLKFRSSVLLVLVLELQILNSVLGHGRLMEPPNRSSLWRLPEFAAYEPDKNYDDNQLWCGGMGSQFNLSNGKCGPCGDEYIKSRPRENENTGLYGRGIITRTYMPGQVIDIGVELTVNHLGYFLFNLCPLADILSLEEEECFEKYPLPLADGSGYQYKITSTEKGFYNTTVKLPDDLKCRQCVVRWHYKTGNRWNFADNATGGLGIGDQETFRGCSDVAIGNFKPISVRPPAMTTEASSSNAGGIPTSTYAPPTQITTTIRTTTTPATTTSQKPPSPSTTERPRPIGPFPGAPTQRPPKPSGKVVPATSKPAGVANSHPHPIMRPPGPNKENSLPVIIVTLGGSTKHNSISED